MKRIFFILGLAVMLSWGLGDQALAAKQYSSGYFYYHSHDGYVSICGYFGEDETVRVPSTIATQPVSIIESGAFSGCDTVKKIKLPDTIMEIQDGAFSGAEKLVSVVDGQGKELLAQSKSGKSKETKTDKSEKTKDTTADNSEKTKDTTADNSAKTKDGAADNSAKAKDTTADNSEKTKDTTADKSAKEKDTTGDNSAKAKDTTGDNSAKTKDTAADIGQDTYVEPEDGKAAQENAENRQEIADALQGTAGQDLKDSAGNQVTVDTQGRLISVASDGTKKVLDDSQKYTKQTNGSITNEAGEQIALDAEDQPVPVSETKKDENADTKEKTDTKEKNDTKDDEKEENGVQSGVVRNSETGEDTAIRMGGVVILVAAAASVGWFFKKKKKN